MIDLLDVYELAELEQVQVVCFDLDCEALSQIGQSGQCYIAMDPFRLKSTAEEKVKLAHELGHCATWSFYDQRCHVLTRNKCEHTATRWAIKKLVPKDELEKAVEQGRTEPWELAEHFGITEQFMHQAIRYYNECVIY